MRDSEHRCLQGVSMRDEHYAHITSIQALKLSRKILGILKQALDFLLGEKRQTWSCWTFKPDSAYLLSVRVMWSTWTVIRRHGMHFHGVVSVTSLREQKKQRVRRWMLQSEEIVYKAWKCLRNYVLVHECGSGRQKCSVSAFTATPEILIWQKKSLKFREAVGRQELAVTVKMKRK